MTQPARPPALGTMTATFKHPLSHTITVECTPDTLLSTMRTMGKMGCTPGGIPQGGFKFARDQHDNFDWDLLGARKWTTPDGEIVVLYEGESYKQRVLEAVDSKKMKLPDAIKYSRGAKASDPEHVREKGDAEFEYVTLAVFRGGKPNPRWDKPGTERADAGATGR